MKKELLREIQIPLVEWFDKNARALPWREHPSAYEVWVSEIMLQQTRVEAVRPYYARFMEALPDIETLAACPEDQLLKLWEGLGYYSRVRNLQKAAQIVVESYGGRLPDSYEELLTLPGIGSYTAGAIASIAYGKAVPAVDGNVLRVISRITESTEDISRQAVKKQMEGALLAVMPEDRPGTFNQALMELGAMVCVPNGYPMCESCPIRFLCLAREDGRQMDFPVKTGKKPRRIEARTVLVIRDSQRAAICRRPQKGLLAGLYELPNYEGHLTQDEALSQVSKSGFRPLRIRPLPQARHIFSHVEWQMTGYLVFVEETPDYEGALATPAVHVEDPSQPAQTESILFIEPEHIRKEYPIPSAFAAYATFFDQNETA